MLRADLFVAKNVGPSSQAFYTFPAVVVNLALTLRRQPKFYRDSFRAVQVFRGNNKSAFARCAAQVDRDRQPFEGFTRKLHNFSFEKKNHWSIKKSKNRPTERDSCRKTRQENQRGWQKMSEHHCFRNSKVYKQGRSPVRTPRHPDPNNTIGLLIGRSERGQQSTSISTIFRPSAR